MRRPFFHKLTPSLFLIAVAGCGNSSTEVDVRALSISPDQGLVVGVSGTTLFMAAAVDASGMQIDIAGAEWSVGDAGVARIDGRGMVTGVTPGTTDVTVRYGGRSATANLEVYVPVSVAEYLPGVSYFGRNDYVEYIPGELPVILSAPHGGGLKPSEIPNRNYGTIGADRNTAELTYAVRDALIELTGYAPHIVVSHLHRVKLDPNREIEEAAQGDAFAEYAWNEFHRWIQLARINVHVRGEGMYFDMHGHGHAAERLELGYLLSSEELNGTDASLDGLSIVQRTSIRELGRDTAIRFSALLRGPTSLGGMLEDEGILSVPSPSVPSPGGDPYFSGGFNTQEYGSRSDTELVSGIQLEHHYPGLRDTDENRRAYAAKLALVIQRFMLEHIGFFEP
jgi:hypothetical protein